MEDRIHVFRTPDNVQKLIAKEVEDGFIGNMSIAPVFMNDDPSHIQGLLAAAEHIITAIGANLGNTRYSEGHPQAVDQNLRLFLRKFGPWLQSFKNSISVRDGCKKDVLFRPRTSYQT